VAKPRNRDDDARLSTAVDRRPLGFAGRDIQFYVDYTEQLSAGTLTARFDRAGNKIPGVAPNELFTRLGYDQPSGPWKGVGGFVEYVWLDAFYMENAGAIHKSPSSVRFRANRTLISHGRRAAFDPSLPFDDQFCCNAQRVIPATMW
jgi:hypothetical protein